VTSEYRLRRRVNFHETDMAGIVHFSNYFRYMEEAEQALWREAGLSIAYGREEMSFPRVATACDYKSPLKFEDEFEVWIRVAEMKRRTMRYTFVFSKDGEKIATGSTIIVCVSRQPGEPMKAVAFPPEVAGRFAVAAEA
jgi:acyl-CoA thioester hydrolase